MMKIGYSAESSLMDPLADSWLFALTSAELIPYVTRDTQPILAFRTLGKQRRASAKQVVSAGGIENSFIKSDIDRKKQRQAEKRLTTPLANTITSN